MVAQTQRVPVWLIIQGSGPCLEGLPGCENWLLGNVLPCSEARDTSQDGERNETPFFFPPGVTI